MSRVIENPRMLILETAEDILFNEGYSKVNIRRVAKECGIAVGTIYNYFPGKKELIIEMMINFWTEFFHKITVHTESDKDVFLKLRGIMEELSLILRKFKDVWLINELYSTPDYVKSGLRQHELYMGRLISIIEEMISQERKSGNLNTDEDFDCNEAARFIVMNFISMIQRPMIDYDYFEKILRKII